MSNSYNLPCPFLFSLLLSALNHFFSKKNLYDLDADQFFFVCFSVLKVFLKIYNFFILN
jgi:hypothetical protein